MTTGVDRGKTVSLPKELHTRLKWKALKEDTTIRDYVMKLIEDSLKDEETAE